MTDTSSRALHHRAAASGAPAPLAAFSWGSWWLIGILCVTTPWFPSCSEDPESEPEVTSSTSRDRVKSAEPRHPEPTPNPFDPPPQGPWLAKANALEARLQGEMSLEDRRRELQRWESLRAELQTELDRDPQNPDALNALAVGARAEYFQSLRHAAAMAEAAEEARARCIEQLREVADRAEAHGVDFARVLMVRELRWELAEGPNSAAAIDLLASCAPLRSANTAELLLDLSEITLQRREWDDALRWAEAARPAAPRFDASSDFHCRLFAAVFQASLDLGLLESAGLALQQEERAAELSTEFVAANRAAVIVHRLNYHLATNEPDFVIQDVEAWEREVQAAQSVAASQRDEEQRTALEVNAMIEPQLQWRRGLAEHERSRLDPALRELAHDTLERLAFDSRPAAAALRLRAGLRRGVMALEEEELDLASEWIERLEPEIEKAGTRARSLWLAQRGLHGALSGEASTDDALDDLQESFRLLLEEWDLVPHRPGGIGFLQYGERRQVLDMLFAGLAECLPAEESARRALSSLIEAQSRGSTFRALGLDRLPTPTEVQDALLADEALLIWLPAPERTWLFLVRHDSLQLLDDLPGFSRLDRLRKRSWRSLLTQSPAFLDDGKALAEALLPTSARPALASAERWTLCGLNLFGSLPFEALPILGDDPIGLERPLRRLPSLPVGAALARRPAPSEQKVQALLSPRSTPQALNYAHELAPLPLQEGQLDALRELTSELQVHHGEAATIDRLEEACDIRWILAHGVFDLSAARPAGIALSASPSRPDGLLWCGEELLDTAPADLVILAACGAGRSHLRRGDDGSGHLGGAFLQAGSRSVVLSSSNVRYQQTYELCARLLHHRLREQRSLCEAMMHARRDIARIPEWKHPFHHCLLWVEGMGHEP